MLFTVFILITLLHNAVRKFGTFFMRHPIFTSHECSCGNAFGRISLSVCLTACPVCALTFESLHIETLFLVHKYVFRRSRSRSSIKVMGSRSRSDKHNTPICWWSFFDWKAVLLDICMLSMMFCHLNLMLALELSVNAYVYVNVGVLLLVIPPYVVVV